MNVDDPSRVFQIMGGRRRVDFVSYVREFTDLYPHCEVHVGCDSQNHRQNTVYVTTIVFRFPGNGAHVIYRKERVPRIPDLWSKLWGETERSVEIADAIRNELGVQIKQIDLDFNTDPSYPSNKLLSASAGYISSMGFHSQAKPGLLMAAWAADVLCH
ncbi:ribonuclease H-like YkuK family protein [Sanyastnella coralliicola]|uniref:ribonuclease H-like YkuK family protein n=1 Tax=Sanyastnella coralliicola TaxID=3069118 RepID=UPI0027BA9FD3|nr:ribonuclease H-like YkuK family protein [Longitalea sp. SCSIO 12813]